MTIDWPLIGMGIGAYLLGSIPFGIVVAKGLGAPDPRTTGSHNIGFTNVLRVSGKKAGVFTLIGDMGKGWVIGWASYLVLAPESPLSLVPALMVILGHLYSVFLRFQGGKGVATALGALLGLTPWLGLGMLAVWLLTTGVFRYSSGGAIAAFTVLPLFSLGFGKGTGFLVFSVAVSSFILVRHKGNMIRLWYGTEPRMGTSGHNLKLT